jgi:hypothetical protein
LIRRREVTEPQGLFHPCRAYSYAAIAFMLHSIEELEALPAWVAAQNLPVVITGPQLSQAITWITLFVLAVLLIGRSVAARPVQIVVAAVVGAMLANVVSHVALSLATLTYMPGSGTALALVLPGGLWLYRHMALADPGRLIAAGIGVLLMAPVTWAALALAAQT